MSQSLQYLILFTSTGPEGGPGFKGDAGLTGPSGPTGTKGDILKFCGIKPSAELRDKHHLTITCTI